MKYQYVLFDLDGTLTDPAIGITNGIQYALSDIGIHVENRSELYRFIGPPIREALVEFYGVTPVVAEHLTAKYREYYGAKGLFENVPYPGVQTLLERLNNEGCKVVLATSKPEEFSLRILEKFNLLQYFAFTACSKLDGSRDKKQDVIQYALDSLKITNLNEAIMVGDRKYDIVGAMHCGLNAVGVLYGYGSYEELKGAIAFASNVSELTDILINMP